MGVCVVAALLPLAERIATFQQFTVLGSGSGRFNAGIKVMILALHALIDLT